VGRIAFGQAPRPGYAGDRQGAGAAPTRGFRLRCPVGTPVTAMTFGSRVDLEATREQVARALGPSFVAHESDYRGGDYYKALYCGEHVLVQANKDGGEPAEPGWAGPTVVYVEAACDAGAIETALAGLTLLSRKEWTQG
jgi:hypothetical protein